MKPYLLLLLCCFSFSLLGQTAPEPTYRPDFTMENVKFTSVGITLAGTIFYTRYKS